MALSIAQNLCPTCMMKNVTEKNIFSWKDINARMVLCNNYIVCTEFMKTMGFIICMKSLRDGTFGNNQSSY